MGFNINTNTGEREAFICGLALSGGLDKGSEQPSLPVGIEAFELNPTIIKVTSIKPVGIEADIYI